MSYAVVLTAAVPDVAAAPSVASFADAVSSRTQNVRDTVSGEVAPWPVFDRSSVTPGTRIAGPAIVAEDETSTLIGRGWNGIVNGLGYIELTRDAGQ
jgi:N-methylhydantoinase A